MDMKKTAEVLVLGSMLAVSVSANAQLVPAQTKAQVSDVLLSSYVLETFKLNISANVAVQYDDTTATAVAITSASTKGMHSFGATSNGGSVRQCESTSLAAPTPGLPDLVNGCPP
jgi:hypothetical protein